MVGTMLGLHRSCIQLRPAAFDPRNEAAPDEASDGTSDRFMAGIVDPLPESADQSPHGLWLALDSREDLSLLD
jgi:hypothetical protein